MKCPQGQFETFKEEDRYIHQAADVTNGVLSVPMVVGNDSKREIFLLDTAAVRRAKNNATQLFIPTKSGKYVLVPSKIEIEPEPNDSIHLRIDGYLFGK